MHPQRPPWGRLWTAAPAGTRDLTVKGASRPLRGYACGDPLTASLSARARRVITGQVPCPAAHGAAPRGHPIPTSPDPAQHCALCTYRHAAGTLTTTTTTATRTTDRTCHSCTTEALDHHGSRPGHTATYTPDTV